MHRECRMLLKDVFFTKTTLHQAKRLFEWDTFFYNYEVRMLWKLGCRKWWERLTTLIYKNSPDTENEQQFSGDSNKNIYFLKMHVFLHF